MGKKGSWFSAIKRVFTPNSKEKLEKVTDKKSAKEKKKGRGISKYGESKSFIPHFREPSSIEKILGEADEHKLFIRPPMPMEQPRAQPSYTPKPASPRVASPRIASPRVASPRVASPRAVSPRAASSRVVSPPRAPSPRVVRQHKEISYRPEPTLRNQHLSATKIQAAYRGFKARRSFRALRGLVRLQGVVRGQNVKRQTMNAMKHMQLLVRVQTQIQSRRIQMLESQAIHHQAYKNDKETESTLGKWTIGQLSEVGENEIWDDSLLTKEEIEVRMQRKAEAIIKRERAIAYSQSSQLWKASPKSAQPLMDIKSGRFPWWWNWLDRQLPSTNPPESQPMKTVTLAPTRPTPERKLSPSPRPQSSNYKHQNFAFDNLESLTPRSTKSTAPMRTRQMYTPTRTPPSNNSFRYTKPRTSGANSAYDVKDDDSLMSCPPFSAPNYMSPTVSAKAKSRANGGAPSGESKRRFSFPITSNMWSKGSNKDSSSSKVMGKQLKSVNSTGDLSVDSAISMPAAVGRKPFNRFV